jgi:ABC-type Fe3+-siderophore transport system permease subunit
MNFKFTKDKSIVSAIFSIIIGIFFFSQDILIGGFNFYLSVPKYILFLLNFIIAFIFLYFIWSLFEKREGESKTSRIVGLAFGILILLGMVYLIFNLFTTKFY